MDPESILDVSTKHWSTFDFASDPDEIKAALAICDSASNTAPSHEM